MTTRSVREEQWLLSGAPERANSFDAFLKRPLKRNRGHSPSTGTEVLQALSAGLAAGANQVIASSFSGALAHFKRGTLDFKLGTVLLVGGIVGSTLGIFVFAFLVVLALLDVALDARELALHRKRAHLRLRIVGITDAQRLELGRQVVHATTRHRLVGGGLARGSTGGYNAWCALHQPG